MIISFLEEEMLLVPFKIYSDDVFVPKKQYANSAGYDLYAAESKILLANKRAIVKTNLQLAIPKGFFGQIASRSGLAINNGIFILPGIIDSGFKGFVCLIIFNLSDIDYEVKKCNRLAQMILIRHYTAKFILHGEKEVLPESERGDKGFGSSLGF